MAVSLPTSLQLRQFSRERAGAALGPGSRLQPAPRGPRQAHRPATRATRPDRRWSLFSINVDAFRAAGDPLTDGPLPPRGIVLARIAKAPQPGA